MYFKIRCIGLFSHDRYGPLKTKLEIDPNFGTNGSNVKSGLMLYKYTSEAVIEIMLGSSVFGKLL